MPRNATTGVYARVVNSFSDPVFGTLIDPVDAAALFDDQDDGGFNPAAYGISGDIILAHPLTPSALNDPGTLIFLGKGAGASVVPINSTQYLTFLGFNAGANVTTADHITAIGAWALSGWTQVGAGAVTAIGIDALRVATGGNSLVAIGEHAGTGTIIGGTHNTTAGVSSGYYNMGGSYNSWYGDSAGLGVVGSPLSGLGNTGIGGGSLIAVRGAAAQNTALGYFSGASITLGSLNVTIGYLAGGTTLADGIGNVLIGTGADTPASNTSAYLNIGGWLYGDAANFVRTKGAAGTKPPTVFSGVASGTVGTDDSSIIINASGSFTLTLPAAATYPGRWLNIKSVANQTVASASANVGPLAGGALGTAILAATAGKWAQLQSNGTYWEIMSAN